MDVLLSFLALLLSVVGIVGCIVPAIPGVIVSYVGLLCAWGASYSQFSGSAMLIWLAVTLAVTLSDRKSTRLNSSH